jgi:hypothetical protein
VHCGDNEECLPKRSLVPVLVFRARPTGVLIGIYRLLLRTSPISSCPPSTWLSWVAVEGLTRPTYPRPSRSLFSACPSNNCTHRWTGTYLSHVILPGKMGSLLSRQVRRKLCIHCIHYTVTACGILMRSFSFSVFYRCQARGWELCNSCSTAIPLSSTK